MKSSKKKSQPDITYRNEDFSNNILEEPAPAIYAAANPVQQSLRLMGLTSERSFKGMRNIIDFIDKIREGIPKKALDQLAGIISLSDTEIAAIVHTSDRTLRRYTPDQKLNEEQSERIIELAMLYNRGAEVFDDLETFKTWMSIPVDALGGKKPKTFLDTSMGIELLMDELGRIEQGIFA